MYTPNTTLTASSVTEAVARPYRRKLRESIWSSAVSPTEGERSHEHARLQRCGRGSLSTGVKARWKRRGFAGRVKSKSREVGGGGKDQGGPERPAHPNPHRRRGGAWG